MKLWIMSDLHIDSTHYALPPTPTSTDIIVIAGDIADGHDRTLRWLETHAVTTDLPIVFVLGNHEFYGHDFHDLRAADYEKIGVTLLHAGRPSVAIGGVRFVGSTMWTDFKIAGDLPASMSWFNREMPDARDIDLSMRRLRARDVLAQHAVEKEEIEKVLAEPFDGPNVVVTHHGPHRLSLADPDSTSISDGAFASDLTETILQSRPALWIHGHTHVNLDFRIGETRVVSNQRGYSEARKFISGFVVDVGISS